MANNPTECNFGAFTLEQLIASTITKSETTGIYYIRTVQTTVDCGSLVNAPECDEGVFDLELLIRKAIVIDDCSGKPAFNLAVCSCD